MVRSLLSVGGPLLFVVQSPRLYMPVVSGYIIFHHYALVELRFMSGHPFCSRTTDVTGDPRSQGQSSDAAAPLTSY